MMELLLCRLFKYSVCYTNVHSTQRTLHLSSSRILAANRMSLARCLMFCVVFAIATNAVQSQVMVNSEPAMEVDDGAMMLENDLPPTVEFAEPFAPVISPIEMAEAPQAEVTAPGIMPSQEPQEEESISPMPEDLTEGPDSVDDFAEESEEQGARDYDDDGVGRLSLLPTMLTMLFSFVVLL